MIDETLMQFVAFTTRASVSDFTRMWRPVAKSFLRAGVQRIELAKVSPVAGSGLAGVRFVSRNTWPAGTYRQAFPAGLPAEAGAGDIQVAQPGVFRLLRATNARVEPTQPDGGFVVAFHAGASLDANGGGLLPALARDLPETAAAAVYLSASPPGLQPYSLAVTVQAGPDDTPAAVDTLRIVLEKHLQDQTSVMLCGNEVLTLIPEASR